MKFESTAIQGAFLVHTDPIEDGRGSFARSFCRREFERHGLNPNIAQCSISISRKSGTLRGMHYQVAPKEEAKLIRCVRGRLFDVIVDLRPKSPSFRKWFGVELDGSGRKLIYVPEGVAHGFLTLEDDTEVFYQISEFYDRESSRGVRWNDPAFGIKWPCEPRVISPRDKAYGDFRA